MNISADMLSSLSSIAKPAAVPGADAFEDFEAMLLAQVLKTSEESLGGKHSLSGGSAGKMYRELFADELARGVAKSGGVGIAERLRLQEERKQGE